MTVSFHSYFGTSWKSPQASYFQDDVTILHSIPLTIQMKEETRAHPSSDPPHKRVKDRHCLPFAFPASLWEFASAGARSSADTEPTSSKLAVSVQRSLARKEKKHYIICIYSNLARRFFSSLQNRRGTNHKHFPPTLDSIGQFQLLGVCCIYLAVGKVTY